MSSAEVRDLWESNFGQESVRIFHKTDWNRREWKRRWIGVAEAHALGADNVETLSIFYAKELRGIVTQASFWYMSRGNVSNRPLAEKMALAHILQSRKQKLLNLAADAWASIVPFGEIDMLTNGEQDFFAEIEEKTSQYGKDFQIGIAAAYSRTPFLIRTILELETHQQGFSGLSLEEKIQAAYSIMHKWLAIPNMYLMAWVSDGNRTSDGFYDPDATHIHSTEVLWPNITWDIARWAIINMMTHHKVKRGK